MIFGCPKKSRSLEADQRLLINKLDEARREEARAPAPPQPVPQEPPEPDTTKDKQEALEPKDTQDRQEPPEKVPRRNRNSHREIPKIFWRAHRALQERMDEDPTYKEVWEEVANEWLTTEQSHERRNYDVSEIIIYMLPSEAPNACFDWGTPYEQGTYRLVSLPPLLSKLKKNPPTL